MPFHAVNSPPDFILATLGRRGQRHQQIISRSQRRQRRTLSCIFPFETDSDGTGRAVANLSPSRLARELWINPVHPEGQTVFAMGAESRAERRHQSKLAFP